MGNSSQKSSNSTTSSNVSTKSIQQGNVFLPSQWGNPQNSSWSSSKERVSSTSLNSSRASSKERLSSLEGKKTSLKGVTTSSEELQVSVLTEYPEEGLQAKVPFHARVSLVFEPTIAEADKNGIDVVCVLDNSGSMSGSKIQNLKRAMEFVISTLSNKDCLSVCIFNSYPTILQEMCNMTEEGKEQSRRVVRSINAQGGTNIFAGMQEGWKILQERRTNNPSSCMFLLTDGQDASLLAEKKHLAKTMREQGTSLFVFGFGNDHDSAHLLEIANAGEGSFVYVETNDTVIDAFGGAIGSQQGQMLRNIEVEFQMSSKNVLIENILAGSYLQEMDTTWRRSGKVKFADLYGGEKRDFLIQLRLPEIEVADDNYELFSIRAQYQKYGDPDSIFQTPQTAIAIRRTSLSAPQVRNSAVDEQIQRIEVTKCIQEAISSADRNDFRLGQECIAKMKEQVRLTPAYKEGSALIKGLEEDLEQCELKMSSRDVYQYGGGRAKMSETNEIWSTQRVTYSKNAYMADMQCKTSLRSQDAAVNFRSSSK